MPKFKGVPRNRMRIQQGVPTTDVSAGLNVVADALGQVGEMADSMEFQKKTNKLQELKDIAKVQQEQLKELGKLPPVEKQKEAKKYYETKIANNTTVQGLVRDTNKIMDLRRLNGELDEIYNWAIEQGENPEDIASKVIRSEEELVATINKNQNYTEDEKKQILMDLKETRASKAGLYQAIWSGVEGNYTKEQLYNTVGMIKENTHLFDVGELVQMTRVLVDAGVEAGTIKDSEASTIMSAIGDNNLNKILEDINKSGNNDEVKTELYGMINQAIETRNPAFFLNLGYEPFAYGTASTVLNNFKAKAENEVAVNKEELRKLNNEQKMNFTKFYTQRGGEFNGDYRNTRKYQGQYIEEVLPEFKEAYELDPSGTLAELYIDNKIPHFNYMDEDKRNEFIEFMNDPNTPNDMKYMMQKQQANFYLGKVPHDSIEYEIFHDNAFQMGGLSPELNKGMDLQEDPRIKELVEKIQQGKEMVSGNLGKLDAYTLSLAMESSNLAPKELLQRLQVFQELKEEAGFERISERFYTELERLISYHIKSTKLDDPNKIDEFLGRANPTEALLTGGLPSFVFDTIMDNDEFQADFALLLDTYNQDRTMVLDDRTHRPVVVDIPNVEQEDLDRVREIDYKSRKLFYRDRGQYLEITPELAEVMVINVTGKEYGYQLEGDVAYEKDNVSGEFIPFTNNINTFNRLEAQETQEDGTRRKAPSIFKGNAGMVMGLVDFSEDEKEVIEIANAMDNKRIEKPEPAIYKQMRDFTGLNKVAFHEEMPPEILTPYTENEIHRTEEPALNRVYGKFLREGKKSEDNYKTRYKSPEGGTDTIGIGHKMTKKEHDGNYVMIGGEKRSLKTPLTGRETELLYHQDYLIAVAKVKEQLGEAGVDSNTLSDEMAEVALRLTFNTGRVFTGVLEGIEENDMGKVNYHLLRGIGMTNQDNKKKLVVPGIAVDRARSYNMINEDKVNHIIFTKKDGKVVYTYYNAEGMPIQEYATTREFPKKSKLNFKYMVE